MTGIGTILTVICLILLLVLVYVLSQKTVKINSSLDNTEYFVLKDEKEMMTEASNTLSIIHSRIATLVRYLKEHDASHNVVDALESKYVRGVISEAVIQAGSTSYTIDKTSIHVCLRSRDDERQIYDINTLMYVVLHEMSHLVSTSVGHNQEFKKIFRYLVSNAIKANVYTYVDYSKNNVHYCGMNLTTNILN